MSVGSGILWQVSKGGRGSRRSQFCSGAGYRAVWLDKEWASAYYAAALKDGDGALCGRQGV